MPDFLVGPVWEVFGHTVQGAAHVRSGLPNQDAIDWRTVVDGSGSTLILTVSDGHGSKKSFRSDRGAKLAVRTAADTLDEFTKGLGGQKNLSEIGRVAEVDLPRQLVRRWQEGVEADLAACPLSEDDLQQLETADRRVVEKDHLIVYGATLLAVLATPRFLLYLQLGDGDVIVVADDGTASRPLPADPRLFANETLSLCSPGSAGARRSPAAVPAGAWSEFRVRFQPLEQTFPALVLASTDGLANSFRTDADFLKVGTDLRKMIHEDGIASVRGDLGTWLTAASEKSGDDVTLGLICRADGTGRPAAAAPPADDQDLAEALPLEQIPTTEGQDARTGNADAGQPPAKSEGKTRSR